MVRAKFHCVSNEKTSSTDEAGYIIKLFPVASGSKENEQFYKWTPAGSIDLNIVNEGAAVAFEVGKEYYVDFIPADK